MRKVIRLAARALTAVAFAQAPLAQAGGFGGALGAMDGYFKAEDERQARERERQRFEWERQRAENELRLQRQRLEDQRRQREAREREEKESAERSARAVQVAIDKNPKLKAWQESGGPMWERAREVDSILKNLPENRDVPLEDRFAKVVRFVETEARDSGGR